MQRSVEARINESVTIVRGRNHADGSEVEHARVRRDLLRDLPRIDSKYFYDDVGSLLFEEITRLPEYYQTRTEEAILAEIADEVVRLTGARELVELGSGAGRKIRLLLDAMRRRGGSIDACCWTSTRPSSRYPRRRWRMITRRWRSAGWSATSSTIWGWWGRATAVSSSFSQARSAICIRVSWRRFSGAFARSSV